MIKQLFAAVVAAAFLAGVSVTPAAAQATQPAAKQAPAKGATKTPKAKKKPTEKQLAQQQKMKDCSAKWKASGEKGRAKHRAFMKTCLKG